MFVVKNNIPGVTGTENVDFPSFFVFFSLFDHFGAIFGVQMLLARNGSKNKDIFPSAAFRANFGSFKLSTELVIPQVSEAANSRLLSQVAGLFSLVTGYIASV
jgi:hypothetical protein